MLVTSHTVRRRISFAIAHNDMCVRSTVGSAVKCAEDCSSNMSDTLCRIHVAAAYVHFGESICHVSLLGRRLIHEIFYFKGQNGENYVRWRGMHCNSGMCYKVQANTYIEI